MIGSMMEFPEDMIMEDVRIKPCPFCGNMGTRTCVLEREPHWEGYIECVRCGSSGPVSVDPVSAWNNRKSPWEKIDKAPKDGTIFLATATWYPEPVTVKANPIDGRLVSTWDGEPVIESQTDFGTEYKDAGPFTYFMLIPEPPRFPD
jgi:hypothetical protein